VRQVVGVRDHRALHRRRVHLGAQVRPRDLEVLLPACTDGRSMGRASPAMHIKSMDHPTCALKVKKRVRPNGEIKLTGR
jgi:hypothetical protein